MLEDEEREKLKKGQGKRLVDDLTEKLDYSQEQKEALKVGIYAGIKMSTQLDLTEAILEAFNRKYGNSEAEAEKEQTDSTVSGGGRP